MVPSCIDNDVLSNFLAGRISGDQAAEVESHLATCSKCQSQAARHSSQLDSLLAAARSAVVSDPLEKEPELGMALSAIGRLRSPAGIHAVSIDPTRAAAPEIRNYRLIEKLGEGGMGTVYRAVHMHLEKTVALKIMKADRSGNPQAVSRFEREMKAIGRLEHPHIVRALDAGEQGGVYFLVMEYVAGTDLDQLIRSVGPLPVAEACEIVRQAALGLAHAHEHNLVHRDVKPSNLMLSPEGQVKVLDLGLAQFQQSAGGGMDLTIEGQMIGTLLYMSPEQLAGSKNVDHRSDVFSLGVTLYCLLAGGLPLDRGQPAAMLPEINKIRNDIPPEVQALLPRLLAALPEDRIASMAQVAELLKPLASGRPLTTLLKKVRNRPADWTALPPSLLPSRSPPVQTPAAQVTTTRANQDPTLVTPAQRVDASRQRLANWSSAGWAAAGLLLVALAVVLGVANWPRPVAVPEMPGTLVVASADPNDLRLPELMRRQGIRAIGASGSVVSLRPGLNALPPGKYQLVADNRDLQLPRTEISMVASQSQRLDVVLPAIEVQPPSKVSLFATIPSEPGPLVRYTGDLWYKEADQEKSCSFSLKLRAKDEELLGGVAHRWIEIEAVTQTEAGEYKETGLLLINPALYTNEFDFKVKRGWLAAESESIKRRLAYRFPSVPPEQRDRIVVEFDGTNRLEERATELNALLPAERLSVHHALVLLFSAPVPTAPEAMKTWRVMPANDRNRIETHEPSLRPRRHVVQSASDEQLETAARSYVIDVNDDVPFGFMQLIVKNDHLRFSCSYLSSNDTPMPTPPEKVDLDNEATFIASLPKFEPDPIGEALLPQAEGALAKYLGSLERDGQPQIEFEAQLRMAGAEAKGDVALRVLEIRAVTVPSMNGARHVEEARIRIDPARYQAGEFRIEDGWFQTQGETFDFDTGGDLTKVEDGLLMLGKRLPANRLSVHDVLALVFGAQLKASDSIGRLRTGVRRRLLETGLHRVFEETQFPRRGRSSLTADRWMIPKKEGLPLNYEIVRSRLVPFDFCRVNFEIFHPQKFRIVTGLDDDQQRDAPSLLASVPALLDAAAQTANRIRKVNLDNGPNVRVWRLEKGPLIYAEFAGTASSPNPMLPGTIVFLEPRGEGISREMKGPLLHELTKDDQSWVADGRHWEDGQRSRYVGKSSIRGDVTVRREPNGRLEQKTSFESLAQQDRDWIDRQEALRRQVAMSRAGRR